MAEVADNSKRTKKTKTPPKTPEQRKQERRDRFVRLAPKRVNAALKCIGYVANLGNKGGYDYTSTEVIKILEALRGAVKDVEQSFDNGEDKKPAFTL